MSVLQMQHINIYALKKNRKAILETLQREGVIEVTQMETAENDSVFSREDTSAQQVSYMKSSATAGQAWAVLEEYIPSKKSMLASFEGRKPIHKDDYYKYVGEAGEIMRVAYEILSLKKGVTEAYADIAKYQTQIEALDPWILFDLPVNSKGTKSTVYFTGVLPELWDETKIKTTLAELMPDVDGIHVEIVFADQNQTCVFVLAGRNDEAQVSEALRQMGFSRPTVESSKTAHDRIQEYRKKITGLQGTILDKKAKIESYQGFKNALKFMEDYYTMRAEKYNMIQSLANTKHVFVLSGYLKKDDAADLKHLLIERFDAEVELEDANDDTVPVVLKNNKLAEPVESVLKTYSLPNRKEVDPTGIMAFFYYLFFGMMFSDAGYGLVMSLACGWALFHFKNMEEGLKKSIKMFFYCGISTMFWGAMFGSFFGDAVSVICQTFLGMEAAAVPVIPGITTPIWIDPSLDPMQLLMVSFLFGIIHLFTGLGIQGYMHIKNKHFNYFIYDVLSWYLLVGGGILALLSLDMMGDIAGFVLPGVFLNIGGICAGVGAVIILLFAGRESKNPVKRLLKGIYGLYNTTGYLSDILSYSRLLALGLATGVIAQVFNQIGSMFGGSVIAMIAFTVVFVIGHAVNIGINALGAYVHTNRLQFVEFFGKFYEGGGEEFKPFKINTKHFNVREEI